MRKVLEQCPSCGGNVEVTRISCTRCETEVTGRFDLCRFCRLPPESVQFLEVFIKNRGNVKEMERELGVSYWTIRSRLDDIIATLDFSVVPEAAASVAARRQAILDQLEAGAITVQQAAERLDALPD